MEDSVAHLRRPIDQITFNEIKECQIHLSRFEAAVCFEISLVTIRYVYASQDFKDYERKLMVKRERKIYRYGVGFADKKFNRKLEYEKGL